MSIVLTQVAAMNNKFFPASPPSSAVVRARYEPDVRGVNRYRHFHSPVAVQTEHAAGSGGESIDKRSNSKSPRPSQRIGWDLPSIDISNKNADFDTKYKFNNSNPPVDTWRIRRRRQTSSFSDANNLVDTQATEPSIKGRNFPAIVRRTPSPASQTILPSISPSRSNNSILNIDSSILGSPTVKISPEVSIATILRMPSTLNLVNLKRYGHQPKSSIERTTQVGKDARKEPSFQHQIRLEKVPSHTAESSTKETRNASVELNETYKRESKTKNEVSADNYPSKSKVKTAEFGTQTETDEQDNRAALVRSQGSSSSTDLSMLNADRTPKATQTEQLGFFSKVNNICSENNSDMEQRSELLEIIDSALEETIDRHSRQLANQFIASSARKQAQVWKDAKEFVSTMLLPCSIELANRARHCSVKMPYEKVASIKLP